MEYLLDYKIGKLHEFISKKKYATYCVIMDVKKTLWQEVRSVPCGIAFCP